MEYEYTRFGAGFMRREKDSTGDWQPCALDDVPAGWLEEDEARQTRIRLGYDPARRGVSATRILPNPKIDAIAAELGLTSGELRGRLNGDTGGTRKRLDEARFDAICAELGIDPEEARARFRQ